MAGRRHAFATSGQLLAVKTRNNYLKSVMTFFSVAKKLGWIENDIFALVETFKMAPQKNEILTVEQMTAFLNAAPAYRPAFALIAFAGLRGEEVEKLSWSDIKLDSDMVIVSAEVAKTGKERRPEILPNLKQWLTLYAKSEGLIVPNNNLGAEQSKTAKRAGIDWKHNALRNSFASYAVAFKGYDWEARQAGHGFRTSDKNYQAWVDPKEAAKYWAILPA
jgi:integrase/recombinase XerD